MGRSISILLFKYALVLTAFLLTLPLLHAQERPINNDRSVIPAYDTTHLPLDSLISASPDTLLLPADSLPKPPQHDDIETTIKYDASDSILTSLETHTLHLYGNAIITYGDIKLEADEIVIDYEKSTLTAHGRRDSLGNRIGFPVFTNGQEVYETKDIVYNFKNKKARISEVVTAQDEGFLHGETVYKTEDDELFVRNSSYTTCNLEHPHWQIRSKKLKAIPHDKIVSGPFYFEFNGIPLPIGFLFAMLPAPRTSKSGIIFPSYGEERIRGFNLRGGGYFFDISDYVKTAITGDIYSKGGHALYLNTRYNKRYHYQGNVQLSYTKNQLSSNIEDESESIDYRIAWSHSPASTGKSSRFSANVSAATSTYTQNNNLFFGGGTPGYDLDNTTRKMQSSISYSKTFRGTPMSMGINLTHSQDLITKKLDLQLPTMNFNVNNIYPFQRKNGIKRRHGAILDNFSTRYTMTLSNKISNIYPRYSPTETDSIIPVNSNTISYLLGNSRWGMRHDIPLSTSFRALKHLTLSPSFNYSEVWYPEKLQWSLDENNIPVISDTIRGFSRFANYNFGISVSTRIYGTFNFKRGSIKAIRHIINPSISYNYTPDFSKAKYGYYQQFSNEDGKSQYYSRYQGFTYGSSAIGESQAIGFRLNNNFEAKIKTKKDSVVRKISLLNNLSFASSYNMVADSFKLAPITMGANTTLFNNKLNMNLAATMDPYQLKNGRRIDTYEIQNGKLGRITNANMSMSTNFNPKGRSKDQESREKIGQSDLPEEEKQYYLNNPDTYVDFEIPWSLRLNYSLNYSKLGIASANITQNLSASGDLSLSEKWKITFNSSYDFENHEISRLDLNISRDLHCWTMFFSWIPLGRYQSYNFTIRVKASVLQDLKIERRKPFYDNL